MEHMNAFAVLGSFNYTCRDIINILIMKIINLAN